MPDWKNVIRDIAESAEAASRKANTRPELILAASALAFFFVLGLSLLMVSLAVFAWGYVGVGIGFLLGGTLLVGVTLWGFRWLVRQRFR